MGEEIEEHEEERPKETGTLETRKMKAVEEDQAEVPEESEQRQEEPKVQDAYTSDSSLTPPPETPKAVEEEQITEEIVTIEENQPIEEPEAAETYRSSSLTPVPEDPMEAPEQSSSLTPLEETPELTTDQPVEPAHEYQPQRPTHPTIEAVLEEELPEYSELPQPDQTKDQPKKPYELEEAAEEPPYSPQAPSVSPISTPATTNLTPRATPPPPPPEDVPEIPFRASQILTGPALLDALQQARESTQLRMAASQIPHNYPLPATAYPPIPLAPIEQPSIVEEEQPSTQDTLPHPSQYQHQQLNESFQSNTSDHPVLSQPLISSPRPEAPVPSPLTMMRSPQKAPGKRKWGMDMGEIPDSDEEDEVI
ncbi:hypothetical protein BZA77DRAFT_317180 [Pyronema omphalodes]|nr:hypothetical protein BZA77DRAFT_317180 [Pyronema omphalodes]